MHDYTFSVSKMASHLSALKLWLHVPFHPLTTKLWWLRQSRQILQFNKGADKLAKQT